MMCNLESNDTMFWSNPVSQTYKTKDDLLGDLGSLERIPKLIVHNSLYRQIVNLIAAQISSVDTTLADPSLLNGKVPEGLDHEGSVPVDIHIGSWTELVDMVREAASSNWNLGLFTSGSTGAPKHLWQTAEALTRSVKTAPRFEDHRWGLCYEISHMAGLQVFLQAISNGNSLCYLFESNPETIGSMIETHQLTHLSATPTFYRVRLLRLNEQYPSVRRLTSGGEPFDSQTMDQLRTIFPEAQVRNVYALTETGPLFESDTERFEIPEVLRDSVRISRNSELLLDEALVSDAATEDVDEKGWFHTGDLVRQHGDGEIEFLGRDTDEVTVAGYQVHPQEVEKAVLASDRNIVEAVVRARDSSVTGNILVADLVLREGSHKENVIQNVRDSLGENMPQHKIPRKFYVVDEINRTRSGKKKRS